ncbi:Protein MEMO1 (Mediator of ErbB2-driven cell motility 1) (Memo-1), partial [Durusdinium trenchii]
VVILSFNLQLLSLQPWQCRMGSSRPGLRGVRRPIHAGSWYEGDPELLRDELQEMLGAEYAEGATADRHLKAVISPHAGLRYSGSVAAGVFARIDASAVQRVVLIGPSHHAYLEGCALPAEEVQAYRTPLGDLPLDTDTLAELRKTKDFSVLPMEVDEAEHSVEMQLPFLALLLQGPKRPPAKLVPMLVGQVDAKAEALYGQRLAPLLQEEGTIFVISSDFCHWGAQFGYTRVGSPSLARTYRDGPHPDNAKIEGLDREGMALIEEQNAEGFRTYLKREGNTICGRHPILVLLETLAACRGSTLGVDFVKYAQSSALPGMPPPRNASVSYACALCRPRFV